MDGTFNAGDSTSTPGIKINVDYVSLLQIKEGGSFTLGDSQMREKLFST